MSVSNPVTVDDVAYAEFLVFPVRIGCRCVVGCRHAASAGVVHIVLTVVEVDNLVVVAAYVVAHVETGRKGEFLREKLVFVSRNESVPFMGVVALCHNEV